MPRVSLNPVERKKWLLHGYITRTMHSMKISQKEMAADLEFTQQYFSKKLSNCDFSYAELLIIFRKLETDEKTKGELLTL